MHYEKIVYIVQLVRNEGLFQEREVCSEHIASPATGESNLRSSFVAHVTRDLFLLPRREMRFRSAESAKLSIIRLIGAYFNFAILFSRTRVYRSGKKKRFSRTLQQGRAKSHIPRGCWRKYVFVFAIFKTVIYTM